jgi:ribosomal protein L37AE/L43A
MTQTKDERPDPGGERAETRDVQCPNCCKRAPITARRMGLLFYRCELCGSVGATPEPAEAP